MEWRYGLFASGLVVVMGCVLLDRNSLPTVRERVLAAAAWPVTGALVLLGAGQPNVPAEDAITAGGAVYWTAVIATGGRPACLMDQLLSDEVRGSTRRQRGVGLAAVLCAAVIAALML